MHGLDEWEGRMLIAKPKTMKPRFTLNGDWVRPIYYRPIPRGQQLALTDWLIVLMMLAGAMAFGAVVGAMVKGVL